MQILLIMASAMVITGILVPAILWLSHHHGWYDTLDQRKIHVGEVPRLGGLGISLGFFITVATIGSLDNPLFPTITLGPELLLFLGGVLVVHIMGVVDDFRNLRALLKLAIQVGGATLVALGGVQIRGILLPVLGGVWLDFGFLSLPLTVFWIISISNAINLIDGLDALAGTTSLIATLAFAIIHTLNGNTGATIVSLALAGALLGFLFYNKPKAKIFMGDGGAYFLGIILASLPLLPNNFMRQAWDFDVSSQLHLVWPALEGLAAGDRGSDVMVGVVILLVPVADMLAAILRRARRHLPFHTPDREHIHHKLLDFGLGNWAILGMVQSANLVFASLAVLMVLVRLGHVGATGWWWLQGLIGLGAVVLAVVLFAILHEQNRRRKRALRQTPTP